MERYNGWEDPAWRDYWGMNDDDNYDEDYSVRDGTASAYLEGQILQEQERLFRSTWETDDYI